MHALSDGLMLADSYHCSRLNTNTRKLSPAMFEAIFAALGSHLDAVQSQESSRHPEYARN
jgi:uracil-DNA glycosylase